MRIRLFFAEENPNISLEDQMMTYNLMQALSEKFWQALDPYTQKLLQGCIGDISGRPGNMLLTIDCLNQGQFMCLNQERQWIQAVSDSINQLVGGVNIVAVYHPQTNWLFYRRLYKSESSRNWG